MSGIISPPSGTLPHTHDASNIVSGALDPNRLPATQNATAFVKNDAIVDNWLFQNGQLQCFADNGGLPAFGLHSGNKEAIAIYYLNSQLRSKRNTGQDYAISETESGTWTPDIRGSSVAGSHTYLVQSGYWQRTGQLIFASFRCNLSAKGTSSGDFRIGGLPFSCANSGHTVAGSLFFLANMAANNYTIGVLPNTALISVGLQSGTLVNMSSVTSNVNVSGTVVYPIS